MKLLFDQNISHRITGLLNSDFSDSKQVRELGLENSSDNSIFEFARTNSFTIVTFDSDFIDLNIVKGGPPKIIWLRTGNLTTKSIVDLLHKSTSSIQSFLKSEELQILEIIQK